MAKRSFFVFAAVLLAVGCGGGSDETKPPLSFGTMKFDETWLYPLADGTSLLLITDEKRAVFYMASGAQSVAIDGLPESEGVPEVYPLAAGGAYLHYKVSEGRSALYLVEGSKALPVKEAPGVALQSDRPPLSGFAWAAQAAEETRARHRRYLEEREDEEASAEPDDNYRL